MRRSAFLGALLLVLGACSDGDVTAMSGGSGALEEDEWLFEPVDIALLADGGLVVASRVQIAHINSEGDWSLLTESEGLPEGKGMDGWPGRTVNVVAAGGEGGLFDEVLWAAGFATSPGDDEDFGGTIDSWSGGRFLGWVARYECAGPLCRWNAFTSNEIPELAGDVSDLVVADDGTAFATAGDNTLLVFDDNAWTSHAVPGLRAVYPWSSSLAIGPDGVLWAGTNSPGVGRGLYSFDGSGFTQHTTADGLPSDTAFQVAAAPDGTIWVATDAEYLDPSTAPPDMAAGIASFDGNTWTSHIMADGLLNNDAVLAVGSDGTVWAVHYEIPPYGYSRFDGERWIAYPADSPVGGFKAEGGPDGVLWTVTDQGLIINFDGTSQTLYPSPFITE